MPSPPHLPPSYTLNAIAKSLKCNFPNFGLGGAVVDQDRPFTSTFLPWVGPSLAPVQLLSPTFRTVQSQHAESMPIFSRTVCGHQQHEVRRSAQVMIDLTGAESD